MGARLYLLILFFAVLGAVPSARAVALGATKEEVIAELGQPRSQSSFGDKEILTYPKGVRIELVEGHVQRAEKITLTIPPDPIKPTPLEEEPLPEPTPSPPPRATASHVSPTREPTPLPVTPSPAPTALPPSENVKNPAPTPGPSTKPSVAAHLPTRQELLAAESEEQGEQPLKLPQLLLLLGFHFAVTLIGLEIAFKVWTMDALLSGVLAITGIDLALHAILELLGPVTSGLSTYGAIENGIPGIVMIFSIHHFCFTKDWSLAVRTTSLVKLVVFLLKTFVAMSLMRAAFH